MLTYVGLAAIWACVGLVWWWVLRADRSVRAVQHIVGERLVTLKGREEVTTADFTKLRADVDDLFTLFRRLNGRVNQLVGAKAEERPAEESPLDVRRKLRGM